MPPPVTSPACSLFERSLLVTYCSLFIHSLSQTERSFHTRFVVLGADAAPGRPCPDATSPHPLSVPSRSPVARRPRRQHTHTCHHATARMSNPPPRMLQRSRGMKRPRRSSDPPPRTIEFPPRTHLAFALKPRSRFGVRPDSDSCPRDRPLFTTGSPARVPARPSIRPHPAPRTPQFSFPPPVARRSHDEANLHAPPST